MRLFPRQAPDLLDRKAAMRAWAHRILDEVRMGYAHSPHIIERALRLTGDLE